MNRELRRYYKLMLFSAIIALTAASEINAQIYFNIQTATGTQYVSTSDIRKITFSGSGNVIDITLNTGTVVSDSITKMEKMTFDATGGGTPLPVELTSFSGKNNKGFADLAWTTASERNTLCFDIEGKKESAATYSKVGQVLASGNSNAPRNYSFKYKLNDNGNYNFRLKMIDNNGTSKYSDAILVENNIPLKFDLFQNYPNPFNPTTTIRFSITQGCDVKLKVVDVLGNEVAKLVNEYRPEGVYNIAFDASNLSSGVYFYILNAGSFNSSKKMIVIK